jgi:DNA modification methylase
MTEYLGPFELGKVHCVDALEALPLLPDGCVDLALTDLPYANGTDYGVYDDTFRNLIELSKRSVPEMIRVSSRVAITPGVENMSLYPHPAWTLAWVTPAGTGSSRWGFCCWQPIMVYGKDPYLQNGLGRRSDTFIITEASEKNGHPCPKPIGVWTKIMGRCSVLSTDIILDPFMGSGTTGVAAVQLGRKFLGFEISQEYCGIANKRIEAARKGVTVNELSAGQGTLFSQ